MKKTDLVGWIRWDHERLGQAIELLDRCVFHLRFEGKQRTKDNIDRIRDHVNYLHDDMNRRMRYEEEVLFPFLSMHIPRIQPLFDLLRNDHLQFESEFKELSDSVAAGIRSEILVHGDFLIGLLRSHWLLEGMEAIAPLQDELKRHEKDRLNRLWAKIE